MNFRRFALSAGLAAVVWVIAGARDAAAASPAADREQNGGPAVASGEDTQEDLRAQTQNPVADLISVPFQSNFNFGVGPRNATQWVLNVQPVVPFRLSDDWNLITRTVAPIINQPSPARGIPNAFGLGDINPTVFLAPNKSSGLIWGIGPTMTVPSGTDGALTSGRWAAGPSAVVLTMQGKWVLGALANHQWDIGGWRDRKYDRTLIQPFINHNLPNSWYVVTSPIITADWESPSGDRWVVPVGGGVGKITRLGKLPLNVQLGGYYNVEKPAGGPDWQLRFQLQFLFPKG
jgi:hypothetical protein